MRSGILLLIGALTLTGCGKQIADFVRGPDSAAPAAPPILPLSSGKTLKVSPGHTLSKGTTVGASLTLTPTHRHESGTHVDANVSFHQSRVQ